MLLILKFSIARSRTIVQLTLQLNLTRTKMLFSAYDEIELVELEKIMIVIDRFFFLRS